MALSLAMDGPVGAGKSTIADEVARRLGILHLDTGAMYRAVGLTALKQGVDLKDEQAVTTLCEGLDMTVRHEADGQRTLVDGEDLTGGLRTEEVSMAASTVSGYRGVRKAMVRLQQKMAETTDMLLDGRDIGTVVLPDATVKIYLTASPEERARRRWEQLKEKGMEQPFPQVLADLVTRDRQDMTREVDPLRQAADAVVVDSTNINFEETVEQILKIVRERTEK